jgi:glycogen debranching enzyme
MRRQPSVPAEHRALHEAVTGVYDRNRQRGHAAWCDRDYDFVCPSHVRYPFQWLWDSCFHAIVLTHLDIRRAESEVASLLANVHEDGLISHVTFWQRAEYEELLKTYGIAYRTPYLSDCIQPPVIADTVAHIARRGGDPELIRTWLPLLVRNYDYLDRVRDPDQDGLITTLQADESGLDHSPKYDAYRGVTEATAAAHERGWHKVADAYDTVGRDPARMFALEAFQVEDVLVNVIYAEGTRALAELLEEHDDPKTAAQMRARCARTADALLTKCWHEERGLFFDLAGPDEEMLEVSTVSSLMPLLLPDLPADRVARLVGHLTDPSAYAAPYPVPSVSMAEPSYHPGYLEMLVWRGPSWINTNWYVARGLRRHGHDVLARQIEDRSIEIVMKHGFHEYYDPGTGEPHGAPDFGWSALALDMALSRDEATQ